VRPPALRGLDGGDRDRGFLKIPIGGGDNAGALERRQIEAWLNENSERQREKGAAIHEKVTGPPLHGEARSAGR
jgi:hypothetical protein